MEELAIVVKEHQNAREPKRAVLDQPGPVGDDVARYLNHHPQEAGCLRAWVKFSVENSFSFTPVFSHRTVISLYFLLHSLPGSDLRVYFPVIIQTKRRKR